MVDYANNAALRTGPIVKLLDLEYEFGACVGVVLGFGEGDNEVSTEGKWNWCAAMLPHDNMVRYVNNRHKQGQHGPFLIGLGSYKRAAANGGVGEALHGVALAADASLPARDVLWPDQLVRPDALNDRGEFRWHNGVPLLRVWLCERATPFVELTGVPPRFNQSHGLRVVPLEEIGTLLAVAARGIALREVTLDRPSPLNKNILKLIAVVEGRLKYRLVGKRERDKSIVLAVLLGNRVRYGKYTCEDCGYQPALDHRVPSKWARSMLEVHHIEPLASGERVSQLEGLIVLCPLCHKREHVLQYETNAAARKSSSSASNL